jgi:hypothetical protein
VNAQHIPVEDLVLYSMQSLSAGETSTLALHLESCTDCSRQLAEIYGDLALFSLGVDQQPVSTGARDRFLNSIATQAQATPAKVASAATAAAPEPLRPAPAYAPEPRRAIQEVKPRRNWFPILIPWAGAFALLTIAGYFGSQNQKLNELLNNDKGQIAQLSAQAASAQQTAQDLTEALTSPNAKQVTLTEGKGVQLPSGRTSYLASKGALVFIGNNLKAIPAGKTYELWIIPADGKAPVPAGLFRPDEHGTASVVLPKLPEGVPAKAFGVTIENAEGAASPTMPIVLSGAAGL